MGLRGGQDRSNDLQRSAPGRLNTRKVIGAIRSGPPILQVHSAGLTGPAFSFS
jgi:hypothetical protein